MMQDFTYAVSIYCLVIFYFLTVCHGRLKRGVVLGILLMIAQSVWAFLECIACLTSAL